MDKALLYKAIKTSSQHEGLSTEELEKLSAAYPWFSTAQMLLSRRYKKSNDYRFTEQLHRTAIVAGNRRVLFQLIHESATETSERHIAPPAPVSIQKPVEAEQAIEVKMRFRPLEEEPKVEKHSASLSHLADTIFDEENKPALQESTAIVSPVITPKEFVQEPQALVVAPVEIPAELPEPIVNTEIAKEVETKSTIAPAIKLDEMDPLQREILLEAVHSSIELEVSEDVGTESDATNSETEEDTAGGDGYAAWLARRARQLHFGEKTTESLSEEEEIEEEEPVETEWDEEEKEENDDSIFISKKAPEPVIPSKKEVPVLRPRNLHQDNLIDRFIKLEPKIAAGKAAEYQPGNLAKESLQEDFSIVTETMAQLFAKQGKIDKARKAYRKLMAQFPEKSVYFAAQLKNLDKLKKG